MAQGMERIPLAVDSDFQAQPVRANFPDAPASDFKLISFEPDQVQAQPAPARMGAGDTLSSLGRNVWDAVVYHTPAAVAAAVEGDDPYATWDWKDALIERARQRAQEVSKPGDANTKTAIPGITAQDINSLGPSVGFSVAGAATGLGAGIPAGMVASPVAGYAAGMAASGTTAYRMATNQFVRDLHDTVNAESIKATGKPVSPQEFQAKQAQLADTIKAYGLWEAVPEAAGNALSFGILTAPVKGAIGKLFGKNIATRFAGKLGALYGEELATETVTQMGQHNAEVDAGMVKAPKREFTSPQDWQESLKEVAGPTILQTTLMAGGFKAGQMAKDRIFGRKGDEQPDNAIPADQIGAGPGGGSGAIEGEVLGPEQVTDQRGGPVTTRQPETYTQITPTALPRIALPAPEDGGPSERQVSTAIGLLKHSPKASPELLQRLMRVDQTMATMLFNHWQGQTNGQVAGNEAAEIPAQSDQGQGADIAGSRVVDGFSDGAVSFTPGAAAKDAAPGGKPGMAMGATGPDAITALDVQARAAATSPFNATPQPTKGNTPPANSRELGSQAPRNGMQERAVRADESGSPELAQSGSAGGRVNDSTAIPAGVQEAALKAARSDQDRSNAFDLAAEVKSISEGGNVDLSSVASDPRFWDAENEEFTPAGNEEVDRLTLEQAKDNLRLPEIQEMSDLDHAFHKAQYLAMLKILDGLNIPHQDTSSAQSKYIEVGGMKLRFADHANQVRDSAVRGSLPIINVAPGESTFTEALNAVLKNQEERSPTPVAESQAPAPSEPGDGGVAPTQDKAAPATEERSYTKGQAEVLAPAQGEKSITQNKEGAIYVRGYPEEQMKAARDSLGIRSAVISPKGGVFPVGTPLAALKEALNPGAAYLPSRDEVSKMKDELREFIEDNKFNLRKAYNHVQKHGIQRFHDKAEAQGYADKLAKGEGGNWTVKRVNAKNGVMGYWHAEREGRVFSPVEQAILGAVEKKQVEDETALNEQEERAYDEVLNKAYAALDDDAVQSALDSMADQYGSTSAHEYRVAVREYFERMISEKLQGTTKGPTGVSEATGGAQTGAARDEAPGRQPEGIAEVAAPAAKLGEKIPPSSPEVVTSPPTVAEEAVPNEFEHAGYAIRKTNIKRGDQVVQSWAVQSEDNRVRAANGERQIGGDSLHDTREDAIKEAERQSAFEKSNKESRAKAAEVEAAKRADKASAEDLDGFADSLTPMQRGKVVATMTGRIRIGGVESSLRDAVRKLVADGEVPQTRQEDVIKEMSRAQFNRADQRTQDAHEKKRAEAGKKTVYSVGGYDLGKTAHDYAAYLIGKQPAAPNPIADAADAMIKAAEAMKAAVAQAEPKKLSSEEWRNEGMTPEQIMRRKADGYVEELAGQIQEESAESDFDPKETVAAVKQWADDTKIPEDVMRKALHDAVEKRPNFRRKAGVLAALKAAPEAGKPAADRIDAAKRRLREADTDEKRATIEREIRQLRQEAAAEIQPEVPPQAADRAPSRRITKEQRAEMVDQYGEAYARGFMAQRDGFSIEPASDIRSKADKEKFKDGWIAASDLATKEPWQMTRSEYAKQGGEISYSAPRGTGAHRDAVEDAFNRGEKVPQEVLKDYPWLAARDAIKPYVENLQNLSDNELKAEEKRATAALNKWANDTPALNEKDGEIHLNPQLQSVKSFEVSEKFDAVNKEIDRRAKDYPDLATKEPAQGAEKVGESAESKLKGIAERIGVKVSQGAPIAQGQSSNGNIAQADTKGNSENTVKIAGKPVAEMSDGMLNQIAKSSQPAAEKAKKEVMRRTKVASEGGKPVATKEQSAEFKDALDAEHENGVATGNAAVVRSKQDLEAEHGIQLTNAQVDELNAAYQSGVAVSDEIEGKEPATKEPWQMTSAEFGQAALEASEYRAQYERKPEFKAEFMADQVNEWRRVVEKAGEAHVIPDNVLDDYVAQFGESTLASMFRGVSEKGASQWEPAKTRIWDKTYKQFLADHSGAILHGNKKDVHRSAIKRALAQGKPVPANVLADYPDLATKEPAQGAEKVGAGETATQGKETAESLPSEDAKVKEVGADTTAPKGNTEDAGAELTYNKRNRLNRGLQWEDIENKDAALRVAETVKPKVYPKPDYQALIDGGMQPVVAHIVKQAYDSIAIKPQTRSAPTDADLKLYIDGVNRYMAGVMSWAGNDAQVNAWLIKIGKRAGAMLGAVRGEATPLSALAGESEKGLLESVYPNGWKESRPELMIIGGNKALAALQPSTDEAVKALKDIDKGWPGKQEAWQKQGYQIFPGDAVTAETYEGNSYGKKYVNVFIRIKDKTRSREIKIERFADATSKEDPAVQAYIAEQIAKVSGKQLLIDKRNNLLGIFDTTEQARDKARELTKREGKDSKVSDKGISVEYAERTGPARRMEGEDIGSDKLRDTFGFKGVNFGNWMKGDANTKERQLHLNHAYDAFLDLAEILNVPPKAMSLNGMLGLAIGAQGTGQYAAHFVPGVNEINLTRTSGAGSLAHEWGHALDHYFARLGGLERETEPFLTEHTNRAATRAKIEAGKKVDTENTFADGLRPEILAKFKAIVTAMNKRNMTADELKAQQASALSVSKSAVDRWLASIRRDFDANTRKQGELAPSLMEKFDAMADRIRNQDLGDGKIAASSTAYLSPVVVEMRDAYKRWTGNRYSLDQLKGLQSNIDSVTYRLAAKDEAESHAPQTTSTQYSKNAASLDKDKGGKRYWSTDLEKFARAFDAFVSDELDERAAKNTYLSHAGRGGETVPAGTEREAINTAFRDLVAEIKTKETDKGVAMESRSRAQGSATTESTRAIQSIVGKFLKQFAGAADLDIRVVRTVADIPERFRPSPFAEGVFHDDAGLIYLVAMNLKHANGQINASRVWQVLLHESVGHAGLAKMMGSRFGGILKEVMRAARAKGEVGEDIYQPGHQDYATVEAVRLRYPKASDAEVAQEVLARIAETDPGRTLFGYVRAVVRQWLRDMARAAGITIDVTTAELNDLVAQASRYMRRGDGVAQGVDVDALGVADMAVGGMASRATGMESRAAPTAGQPKEPRTGILDTILRKAGGELAAKITGPAYDKLTAFIGGKVPEGIKAGMVSDYGLDESYIDRRTGMQTEQQKAARQTKTFVEGLMDLDRAQSRVAYQWLNNRGAEADRLMAQLPPESQQVLKDIKAQIAKLTIEAVRLGQLDAETAKRNFLAYLHRSYAKYDLNTDDKTWKAERAKAIKILGDQYKGRGLKMDVDPDRIHSAPGWWQDEMKGKRVKVLKNEAGRFAFVAEGTAIPPNLSGYKIDGVWEIRARKAADRITLWRDFTQDERTMMGELDEAKYAVARTLFMMNRDIEVGRFHEWVADEYAKTPEEAEEEGLQMADASDSMMRAFTPDEWVTVPTAKIPGTGVFKYGALAGMVVPGPVWNDIRQISAGRFEPFGAAYASILRAWKLSKTALTPTTHVNNIMGNFVMADMHDVGARDAIAAVRLMVAAANGDKDAKAMLDRFEDSGATQGMFTTHELKKEVLEPLLQQLREEVGMADDEAAILKVSAIMSLALHGKFGEAWAGAKAAAKQSTAGRVTGAVVTKAQDYYQAEDSVFRLAAFLKSIDEGKTDQEAGKLARKAFLDYHINAPWINAMRGTAMPFIAFAYRAIPMLAETAAKKPWKIAKYMLVAGGLNALAYAMLGADADEDKERAYLPDEKAGRLWGIVPKLIRMPWNRESKLRDGRTTSDPVFLDVRRWIPVGDVVDYGQDKTALPMIPQPLIPGGPLIMVAEFLVNKSAFTGKELTKETDTWVEKAAKVGGHFYKGFAPNVPIPYSGTWAGTKIDNAIKGKEDPLGRAYPVPEAIASGFGLKLERYPVDTLQRNAVLDMKGKLKELSDEQRQAARDYGRQGMTKIELDEKVTEIVGKKNKAVEEYKAKERRAMGRAAP